MTTNAPAVLIISKVKEALKRWKDDALCGGTNPDALLFYFCGHGGAVPEEGGIQLDLTFYFFLKTFIMDIHVNGIKTDFLFLGYVPIESSAVEEQYGDTHIFSGTVRFQRLLLL